METQIPTQSLAGMGGSGNDGLFMVVSERNTPALFGSGKLDAIPDEVLTAAAKEKFARLGCKCFMSLDLEDYQSQLDRALSWLLSVPDPRAIESPPIEPPVIRLIEAVDANGT